MADSTCTSFARSRPSQMSNRLAVYHGVHAVHRRYRTCHTARGRPAASVFSSAVTAAAKVFMSYLMALWLMCHPASQHPAQ